LTAARFLTWDFDGTLAFRPGQWAGVICEVVAAARHDLGMTPERLRPYLQNGFPWHAPDVVRTPCPSDQWWSDLLAMLARAVQSAGGCDAIEARRLVDGVRAAYTDPRPWRLFGDVLPALTALRDRGWHHVILSNHVPELPALVGALGLGEVVTSVFTSGTTGVEKPHRQAFEMVFARHPAARDGWMIGDNWHADVQGARAVGLRAILVRAQHPEAELRCATLDEVVAVVDGALERR
jgi:putative hydrolase of the HAD superfamily